ncbi:BQ5605_C018g08657 [Microbotryum silenes-dioicae]|uniref:BQ5605_C018g08657 protein n=1 Tax=Microbotryum silenes-dioicae TaxID=796604 RepID=A0A2X0M191_9BASI|nr:BQ5605_C018g08657 [Microbotryum silenes-dioicae]
MAWQDTSTVYFRNNNSSNNNNQHHEPSASRTAFSSPPPPSSPSAASSSSQLSRSTGGGRKPLFNMPDPLHQNDDNVPLYDPRGLMVRTRKASTGASSQGTSERSREGSLVDQGSSSVMATSPPSMFVGRGFSPGRDDDGDVMMQDHQGEELGASSSRSVPLHPTTRTKASFNRLRVGSSGAPAPPSTTAEISSNQTSPLPGHSSEVAIPARARGIPISRSRASSTSTTTTTGTGPVSPAASWLSSFSPSGSANGPSTSFGMLRAGDEEGFVIGGYTLGRQLGQGAFGVVREATRVKGSSTGEPEKVAVKIIRHQLLGHAQSAGAFVQEPVSIVGEALRRSASGYRLPARDRRLSNFERERHRSTSSPVPSPDKQSAANQSAFASLQLNDSPKPTPEPEMEPKTSFIESLLAREIHLWQQLARHPNLLNLLTTTRTDDFTYIFMPICEGGTLLEYLNAGGVTAALRGDRNKPKSRSSIGPGFGDAQNEDTTPTRVGLLPRVVLPIFAQLVEGLYYLHVDARVLHRDIKLENILFDEKDQTWKIADFGLAESLLSAYPTLPEPPRPASPTKGGGLSTHGYGSITPGQSLASLSRANSVSRPDHHHHHHHHAHASDRSASLNHGAAAPLFDAIAEHLHPAGSLPYCSPEQMASPTPILSPSIDIWALGCVLYALLFGSLPFIDEYEPRLRSKIMKGIWEIPPSSPKLDEDVIEVLRGCLCFDPTQRWDVGRIRESRWLRAFYDPPPTPSRGRQSGRRSLLPLGKTDQESTSSSSRSPSAVRKATRSSSRSSATVKHLGISARTRSVERSNLEKEDRKMRWERGREERRQSQSQSQTQTQNGSVCSSRSASRGRETSVDTTGTSGAGARGRSRVRESSRNRTGSREGLRSQSRSLSRALGRVEERSARGQPY